MDIRIKWVAQFLEDFTRKEDEERELYGSLERLPKTEASWCGFMHDARKLVEILDHKETYNG
jgi:hypothetical protein